MRAFDKGNYSYLPGIPFLSFGVRAHPGYDIVRMVVEPTITPTDALDLISSVLAERGRTISALCAVEFRQFAESPMSREEFSAFNSTYVARLREAGLDYEGEVPVARTNVVVTKGETRETRLNAFCFTLPTGRQGGRDFVLSAIPEVRFSDAGEEVIESGSSGEQAFGRKLDFVWQLAQTRMNAIGADWSQVTAVQLYATDKLPRPGHPELQDQFGLPFSCGITWVDALPPIGPAAVEMDLRSVATEVVFRRR